MSTPKTTGGKDEQNIVLCNVKCILYNDIFYTANIIWGIHASRSREYIVFCIHRNVILILNNIPYLKTKTPNILLSCIVAVYISTYISHVLLKIEKIPFLPHVEVK
jgi:hypothetical protein